MKKWLKRYTRYLIAFEVTSLVLPGFYYLRGLQTLALAVLVFVILNRFLKPIFKILLLPFNLITLGTFRWVANALTFFILTLIIKDLRVESFVFPGFELNGFIVPQINLPRLAVFGLVIVLINLVYQYFLWLND